MLAHTSNVINIAVSMLASS